MTNPPPSQGAVSPPGQPQGQPHWQPQWQPPPPRYQAPPRYQPPPPALAPNGQPLAPFGDRLIAFVIDYAIYLGVSLIWTIPFLIWWMSSFFSLVEQAALEDVPADELPPQFSSIFDLYWVFLLFTLGSMVLVALYSYIYYVEIQRSRGGQTVGKRVMKLRVIPVDPGEAAVGRGGYALRWAVQWMVASVVPLFHLFDGLWQLWDKPLQQCLHDKAAKTVVVKVG